MILLLWPDSLVVGGPSNHGPKRKEIKKRSVSSPIGLVTQDKDKCDVMLVPLVRSSPSSFGFLYSRLHWNLVSSGRDVS
jgi:hypothetical protein